MNDMTFTDAISTCFKKYADFQGTASRLEFWWFSLFCVLLSVFAAIVSDALQLVVMLATFVPQIAVAARRLHDTDRSGWWQLIALVPLVGVIILIVFYVQEGKQNRYMAPQVA